VAVLAIYSELQLQNNLTSPLTAPSTLLLALSTQALRSSALFIPSWWVSLLVALCLEPRSLTSVCSQLFPALVCTSHVQPSPGGTRHPNASTAASVVTILQYGTARQQRHSASLQHMPQEAKLQRYQPSTHSCSKQAASQQLLQVKGPHCQRPRCPARCRQL
jgi:hypothetical protein